MDLTLDLNAAAAPIVDAVRAAAAVEPVGARTHAEVGNPVRSEAAAVVVRAPSGIVRHDVADLTVTVLAATPVGVLDTALAAYGQRVPLQPRDPAATVGGVLATGLSGPTRLGDGPLRDHLLEVRFVTGYGALVQGGGPTVKNVTGYDLPRLLVGSMGTLGVFVQVTLRCRPVPAVTEWWSTSSPPDELFARLFRPAAILADRDRSIVCLVGDAADVAVGRALLRDPLPVGGACLPDAPHRGRISVPPGELGALTAALDHSDGPGREPDLAWLAEWGVGTVHVACRTAEGLARAREVAARHGGWLLREAGGGPDAAGVPFDGFGHGPGGPGSGNVGSGNVGSANGALSARIKRAFDPDGKLAPGRFG